MPRKTDWERITQDWQAGQKSETNDNEDAEA